MKQNDPTVILNEAKGQIIFPNIADGSQVDHCSPTVSRMNQELDSLCRQLAEFEFTQCGMLHEKIQRLPGQEVPLRDANSEHGYLRSEYCSGATRRKRLGCAHTIARADFESILNALAGTLMDQEQVSKWKETLRNLDISIIQVDWQKSDAELVHARQCDELNQNPNDKVAVRQNIENTTTQIQDLIDSHSEYVVQLQHLRDEVLTAVRSAQKAANDNC